MAKNLLKLRATALLRCNVDSYEEEGADQSYELVDSSIVDTRSPSFKKELESLVEFIKQELSLSSLEIKDVKINNADMSDTPDGSGTLEGDISITFSILSDDKIKEDDYEYIAEGLLEILTVETIVETRVLRGRTDWVDDRHGHDYDYKDESVETSYVFCVPSSIKVKVEPSSAGRIPGETVKSPLQDNEDVQLFDNIEFRRESREVRSTRKVTILNESANIFKAGDNVKETDLTSGRVGTVVDFTYSKSGTRYKVKWDYPKGAATEELLASDLELNDEEYEL